MTEGKAKAGIQNPPIRHPRENGDPEESTQILDSRLQTAGMTERKAGISESMALPVIGKKQVVLIGEFHVGMGNGHSGFLESNTGHHRNKEGETGQGSKAP